MSVRSRRTASVIISGSSNLPAEKLTSLSASINKLLQLIVDIYNACEDSSLPPEEKFKKIADSRSMDKDIDTLIYCLGEEMNICSEPIRNNMKSKFTEVSQNSAHLKRLINDYTGQSSFQAHTAKGIFEGMLQLVNDAIELLKMADQHFVERLVNEANATLIYLKQVREAISISELICATQDFTTASVNLVKRLSKRIDSGVLPKDHQQNAIQSLEVLKNESANVINVKRNLLSFPDNEIHVITLDSTVKTIVSAVKLVLDVACADPKFAVDFQVDYVDDEFGLLLAKLSDSVDNCDRSLFVNVLGQIIRAVSNRSVDSGLPHDDPKIKKVKNELIDTRDLSQQCLELREAGVSLAVITSAHRNMDAAIKNLRESYKTLSDNRPADRTSLRHAALQIVASLDKLVVR